MVVPIPHPVKNQDWQTISDDPIPFRLFRNGLKIQQKEVSLIKFFKASEHSLWAGWTVHFSKNDTFINLGGNSGMFIEMKNGHKYFIFSRILYENHERLQKEFIKSGWKIDKENAQKD